MKAWPKKLRELVVQAHRREGKAFPALAAEFEVPVGTVKTWCRRADMKPDMKPALAKGKAGEMKPGTKPGPVMYRGLTARDMPGRDRVQKQLNFAAFRRDAYPPATWKIPGYLEGAELAKAMLEACEKFKPKMRRGKV